MAGTDAIMSINIATARTLRLVFMNGEPCLFLFNKWDKGSLENFTGSIRYSSCSAVSRVVAMSKFAGRFGGDSCL